MQKIGKLLKTNIKRYKIEDQLRSYEILKNWEGVISDCLPEAKGKTMALSFEKGILKIASLSADLAELIRILAKRIIDVLNQLFGRPVVYRIYCVV